MAQSLSGSSKKGDLLNSEVESCTNAPANSFGFINETPLFWSRDSYVSYEGFETFMLKADLGAAIMSALIAILSLAPLFITEEAFVGSGTDIPTLQFPQRSFVSYWLQRQVWPLWNHSIFAGSPFQTGSHSLVYFTTILQYIFPVEWEIKISMLIHIFLAIFFTRCFFYHQLRLHSLAAMIGGVMYGIGGFAFGHIFAGHVDIVVTYPYFPLVFWLWLRALASTRLSATIHAALAFSLMIQSGHVHVVYLALFAIGYFTLVGILSYLLPSPPSHEETSYVVVRPWVLANAAENIDDPKKVVTFLNAALWSSKKALFLGLSSAAMCAFQLWPYLETVASSQRSSVKSLTFALSQGTPVWDALRMIAPHALGDERGTNPFVGNWSPWEGLGFSSVAALVLAPIGLLAIKSTRNKIAILLPTALASSLAVGDAMPFFALYFKVDPFLWRFRVPCRFVLVVSFFLVWLATTGLDAVLKGEVYVPSNKGVTSEDSKKSKEARSGSMSIIFPALATTIALWCVYFWLADALRLDPTAKNMSRTTIPALPSNIEPGWKILRKMKMLNDEQISKGVSPLWPSPVVGNSIVRFLLQEFKRAAFMSSLFFSLISVIALSFPLSKSVTETKPIGFSKTLGKLATLMLFCLVIGEMNYFGYSYLRTVPTEKLLLSQRDVSILQSELVPGARAVLLSEEVMNKAGGHGFSESSGYDTFLPSSFVRACNFAMKEGRDGRKKAEDEIEESWSLITGCCSNAMCSTLGVTHFVSTEGTSKMAQSGYKPMPRAAILPFESSCQKAEGLEWTNSNSRPALNALTKPPSQFDRKVFVLQGDYEELQKKRSDKTSRILSSQKQASASVINVTPNEMVVSVNVSQVPSLLVTSDSFAPGWSFEVLNVDHTLNQSKRDVLSVNAGLGRAAVLTEPGEFIIRFSYWPSRLTQGIIVSTTSYIVLLFTLFYYTYFRSTVPIVSNSAVNMEGKVPIAKAMKL